MDFMSVLIKLFEPEKVLVKCELYFFFFPQLSFKTSLSIYSKAALRLALGAVRGAQQEHAGDEQ